MPIVMLLGPTAAGKTDAAIALAECLECHLINMDSTQVYRGLDIGSAKPPKSLLARHPHALIDIRDPAEPYTAADFVADADREVRKALAAGRTPVLVGGTMLYARAFRDGLAALPRADPKVRAAIEAEAESQGWPKLHARLAEVDPVAAAGIHPHNGVRLQRALEVFETTGRPISNYWKEHKQCPASERLGEPLLEFAVIPEDRAPLVEDLQRKAY
ncbi:MAG: tRNA (adenosine(37)-N6)-dimethylallyltransferase MiaA, partial [Gammaproteobacteria bacterium]|nr:tRNA (adenosine(37)-N6)-dimethylallyltransferase MiaA [Gammaproteobacteria bacterium]